jgi:hypothetical protein
MVLLCYLFFARKQCCESGPGLYVFVAPGSGSVSMRCGSGSGSFHQAKIVRKTLIPTVWDFFMTFYLWNNDENVASKRNKHKT